jgi:transcriptional regulator with XRE-family HTH domain
MEYETGIIGVVAVAVRKARKSLGLSQEDLALDAGPDRTGAGRTYVSQVERGTPNCTIVVPARLARALKTTPRPTTGAPKEDARLGLRVRPVSGLVTLS